MSGVACGAVIGDTTIAAFVRSGDRSEFCPPDHFFREPDSNLFPSFFPGFLLNFVSAPVISAFTSTVAIQVATSQVKGLLGLKVKCEVTAASLPSLRIGNCPMRQIAFAASNYCAVFFACVTNRDVTVHRFSDPRSRRTKRFIRENRLIRIEGFHDTEHKMGFTFGCEQLKSKRAS